MVGGDNGACVAVICVAVPSRRCDSREHRVASENTGYNLHIWACSPFIPHHGSFLHGSVSAGESALCFLHFLSLRGSMYWLDKQTQKNSNTPTSQRFCCRTFCRAPAAAPLMEVGTFLQHWLVLKLPFSAQFLHLHSSSWIPVEHL